MILCPACGKENEDGSVECHRCRAPFEAAGEAGSDQLGEVCRRCDSYNEPGASRCATCGHSLEAPPAAAPSASGPVGEVSPALPDDLSALVLSAVESAEAAHRTEAPVELVAGNGALRSAVAARPAPATPAPVASEKPCLACGAVNPAAAKFCFDCGTPFVKQAPAPAAPRLAPVPDPPAEPSVEADAAVVLETADLVEVADPAAVGNEAPAAFPDQEPPPPAEGSVTGIVAEAIGEAGPPYPAWLLIEKGVAPGTTYQIEHLENRLGAQGAHIELVGDPYVAPHSATLLFVEDRLLIRDEGSVNGVFVRVRDTATLEPGDAFIAGERLLRYEGPVELGAVEEDAPYLGSPRAAGLPVRMVEVLAGGKTGRVCVRGGPTIAVGKAACELSFPTDALLASRHAEVRVAEDGSATLADLGHAASGVWLRMRNQGFADLQTGDQVRIGDQQLRLELG